MRGLRSTIVLAVVLAGLGAYIYFVTSRQPADSGSGQDKVFAGLDSDNITGLTITAENGDVTTLSKTEGSWRMTAPVAGGTDPGNVTGITSALSSLEITRVIDETGANVDEYGLGSPKLQVAFTTNDGASHHLLLGEKTPTGASLYAKRDDEPQVFLVAQFQESTFNKSTFDLRDKSIVTVERTAIDGMHVTADGRTVDLKKTGDSWRLTAPVDASADTGTVDSVISQLQSAQLKSVVSDEAPSDADLRRYGLERPPVSVTIDAGDARVTIDLGSEADTDTVYARNSSRDSVFTVEKTLVGDLGRAPDEYRRHDLFDFRAYNATKVELISGGRTVTFERVKGEGETPVDSWRRTSPAPAADADKSKVEALLAKIADLRADGFVASTSGTGLNEPALQVHVTYNDGKDEERVTFGRSGDDAYASVPGDAGAAHVDATAFDEVIAALNELAA